MAAIELYSTPLIDDANLQAYWRLENVSDSGPNGYTLTNNGAPFAACKFNNGVNAIASSKLFLTISAASAPNLEMTGSQTLMCWIKPAAVGTQDYMIGKCNAAGNTFRMLLVEANGKPRALLSGLTGGDVTSTVAMTDGNVYFVAYVYDGSKLKVWVNDTKTEGNASGTCSNLGTTGFSIGRGGDYDGGYFYGVIDDAAVFNRALSDNEIYQYYRGSWFAGNFIPFL